jgi:hypothetical protein
MNEFTGTRATDLLVLQEMSDNDLANVCQTNKYFRGLCEDENFWRIRTVKNYGPYIVPDYEDKEYEYIRKHYMGRNTTWKKYYLWLSNAVQNPLYGIILLFQNPREDLYEVLNGEFEVYKDDPNLWKPHTEIRDGEEIIDAGHPDSQVKLKPWYDSFLFPNNLNQYHTIDEIFYAIINPYDLRKRGKLTLPPGQQFDFNYDPYYKMPDGKVYRFNDYPYSIPKKYIEELLDDNLIYIVGKSKL